MSYNTLWKAQSQGQANPGGASFLAPYKFKGVSVVDSKGTKLKDLQYGNEENGTYKWFSRQAGSTFGKDAYLQGDLGDGKYQYFKIGDASKSWSGTIDTNAFGQENTFEKALGLTDFQPNKYTGSSGGGTNYGVNMQGQYGVAPADLTKEFPNVTKTEAAPYTPIDPMEFAEKYGEKNKQQYAENYQTAQGMALGTLQTELQGLQNYAPAAAALQRSETAIDNIFNQQQRTQQLNTAMPNALGDLESQRQRANEYATGERGQLMDGLSSTALAMNIGSRSADSSTAGGFGASSSVARKQQDLMSVEQQMQIKQYDNQMAQYGESLLGQNLNATASLALSPTEYSNAASQIRVMPSLSASQLTTSYASDLNQNTMINPTNALQSAVQQGQFRTSQLQGVNDINAAAMNNFALNKFEYKVGYAGAVAGAAQTNINTQTQLALADMYKSVADGAASTATDANTTTSVISSIGSIIGMLTSLGNSLSGALKKEPTKEPTKEDPNTAGTGIGDTSGLTTGTLNGIETNNGGNSLGGLGGEIDVGGTGSVTNDVMNGGNLPFDSGGGSGGLGSIGGGSVDVGSTGDVGSAMKSLQLSPTQQSSAVSLGSDLGLSIPTSGPMTRQVSAAISGSDGMLAHAGVSYQPAKGMVPLGLNSTGRTVYGDPNLAASADTSVGVSNIKETANMLSPTGVLDGHAAGTLAVSGAAINNPEYFKTLDEHRAANDAKSFTADVMALSDDDPSEVTDAKHPSFNALSDAHAMYKNWSVMGPAQKSLALSTYATKNLKDADGTPVLTKDVVKPVIKDGKVVRPGLSMEQTIGLLSSGVNAYPMISNWDQIHAVTKAVTGSNDVGAMTKVATQLGLLGKGKEGAQVKLDTKAAAKSGFTASSHYGIGAMYTKNANAPIPPGYVRVHKDGSGTVVIPKGLESTFGGYGI